MSQYLTSSRSKYRDNQYYEYLINWLELRLSATSSHRPNSSDKLDLQRKMAYTQVVSQEIAKVSEILKETKIQNYCGKFSTSRGSSNIDLQDKVSRHSNALMKIKDELAQKIKQLVVSTRFNLNPRTICTVLQCPIPQIGLCPGSHKWGVRGSKTDR